MDNTETIDTEVIDPNPSDTFNQFSYSLQDESLDDLKKDLTVLGDSVTRGLSVQYESGKTSTSELALRDIYQKFSDKLGMKVGYRNFKECIENIAESNKVQRDILEAVNAKIATDVSQRAIAKLYLTFNILIDRATTMILKATERCEVEDFSPELIGMCDRCVQWMNQLDELKEKASSKISDPDKTLARLLEQTQGWRSVSNKTPAYSQEMINDMLESLSKNYNK